MAGPMQGFLYIHNTILKEAQQFEEAARELDRENDTQVTELSDRFKFFHMVLKEHEDSEEEFFFPPLKAKIHPVAEPYVFDHNHHSRLYDDVAGLLTGLRSARSNSERVELARQLNRQTIALNVMMDIHINKENEVLLPVFDELFTLEEQGSIVERLHASIPQDLMQQMAPWVFRAQMVDDREGLIRMVMEMFPPELMQGMVSSFASAVTPQEWQEMVRRIPELGTYAS